MTDRPIIFSAPMVRALLDGRKTQTRRVLKPQPVWDNGALGIEDAKGRWIFASNTENGFGEGLPRSAFRMPYTSGDRLYVREAHKLIDQHCDYRADWPEATQHLFRWRPSIHMPRWASRLTLIVTDVRVQRLQEISGEDCIAEGVDCETCAASWTVGRSACNQRGCFEIRQNFRTLWNSLHGPGAWAANPWVVAISFDVKRGNIDQIGGAA